MENAYYLNDGVSKLVETGTYRGCKWEIKTVLGKWPTAYVYLPDDFPNDWEDYFDLDSKAGLCVNGGLTYHGNNKIGWDYAHTDDYIPNMNEHGRKWTREDILEEISDTIDRLIEYKWNCQKQQTRFFITTWDNFGHCGGEVEAESFEDAKRIMLNEVSKFMVYWNWVVYESIEITDTKIVIKGHTPREETTTFSVEIYETNK